MVLQVARTLAVSDSATPWMVSMMLQAISRRAIPGIAAICCRASTRVCVSGSQLEKLRAPTQASCQEQEDELDEEINSYFVATDCHLQLFNHALEEELSVNT